MSTPMLLSIFYCIILYLVQGALNVSKSEFDMMKEHYSKIELLKSGLSISKENAKAWGYLGMLLHVGEQKWHRGGSNQEAIRCFDIAINYTDPDDHNSLHDYYLYKSFTFQHIGLIHEALDSLKYALEYASTNIQKANTYQYQGNVM